jgi:glucose/arabinose dehydrogenase
MRSVAFSAVVFAFCSPFVSGVTVPPGFVTFEVAPSGSWQGIVDIAFAPDGRIFVAEKRGMIWIVRSGAKLPEPFLDIRSEVLSNGDRGLLSMALDPAFSSSPHVYIQYAVDPNEDDVDDDGPAFSRLTRYTASGSNPDLADPYTRLILIGQSWADGIPALYNTHTTGTLRFGTDGTLLVSNGDGAHADTPDPGGRDPSGFGLGKFPAAEDIGAFRSQWLGSLAGKILRIDPATGEGLSSNPFYDGNPMSSASRLFA